MRRHAISGERNGRPAPGRRRFIDGDIGGTDRDIRGDMPAEPHRVHAAGVSSR